MLGRFIESYQQHQALYEKRVEAGTQPELMWMSGQFLWCANIFYLVTTFALYRVMKARKEPLKCGAFKNILLAYNATCVAAAGYVVWGIVITLMSRESSYSFVCNDTIIPGSKTDASNATFMAWVFWVFYAQKFWEFFDTWFFIMRKSFRQVTFLHVFHHCSINIVVGVILPFEFNGDMYLPILLNAVVHVLMYSHYLVAAVGLPTPWKPYLTSMQLLQFVTIATQSAMSLSRGDSCGGPYFGKVLLVAYMGSMLILFGNFFYHSYVLNKPNARGAGVVKRQEPVQVTKVHSGRVQLDEKGCARVELPTAFSSGHSIHFQVTPMGGAMPDLHVSHEPSEQDCTFGLGGGVANLSVSWTATMVVTILQKPPPKQPTLSCCTTLQEEETAIKKTR